MLKRFLVMIILTAILLVPGVAQEQSVRPGINDSFRDPNVNEFVGRFEVESREVFSRRTEILAACQIRPGQTVADIGAGTGVFTRLFAEAVGRDGRVISVDIAQKFLDHIQQTSRAAGQLNVETLLCKPDSTLLPANSIDVAFICDTYHHFEFPSSTMRSLFRALRPGGRVILIDFRRVEGESTDWVLSHVRAGQEVFEHEVTAAGFQKAGEEPELLRENYLVIFQKPCQAAAQGERESEQKTGTEQGQKGLPSSRPLSAAATAGAALEFPIIAGHGGVVARPKAAEQPRAGTRVVLDVTSATAPGVVNKGLDRAARLLNLYGVSGLSPSDLHLTIVLHGEATLSALNHAAYKQRFGEEQNPDLTLITQLRQAGVEVFVCGQALNYKNVADAEVADGISIAAAALTVVINRQADGYSCIPVH